MKYLKIAVAVIIVVVATVFIWVWSYHALAVLVTLIGLGFITNRYFARCQFCGSWQTEVQETHLEDHRPGYEIVRRRRYCYRCRKGVTLSEYPRQEQDPAPWF